MISVIITKYKELASFMIEDNWGEFSVGSAKWNGGHQEYISTKYAKLDFPWFDSDNPSGWIYKCQRLFNFYAIEKDDKFHVAYIYIGTWRYDHPVC